ncbi:DUF2339 domain-containing protein [Tenacibaculum jejuense]|uniref:DUF2339 domain-containing protein n=1 Tax=Tenacibaculum jejuense TaxID=584609 RepID=A0A238U4F6_9FLAO|nr:DUF2339 domain-containing protein [Tenacibaculum jejuense]SNR14089.1 conserved membrane protein of unknown function [Tenacibaculum jejuense]
METLVFLILVIGFISINNNINSKFKKLEQTIDILNARIRSLQEKLKSQSLLSEKENIEPTRVEKEPEPIPPIYTPKEKEINTPDLSKEKETVEKPAEVVRSQHSFNDQKKTAPVPEKIIEPKKIQTPKKSWFETFKEKNPDLEKFIGENLINKVGILILVLGISFFVKYAIDKDWINEPARVGIGVLCGALVMGVAHKLKKNYAAFSSVLVAGAISIFYFTIYIGFHEYQLFSQTIAFSIMTVITAFSALVSISYNRQELAVLSLIGGFAAPFMVSTGEGNYIVLFSYIALLNIGILAISYFRKWKIATILDFVFTIVLFAGWLFADFNEKYFSHFGALTFATLFYFIFSITIVLNNLRNKGVFSKIEYFILMANTFYFFGIGMTILKGWESNFTGLFTLSLAIYNLIYATILYKKFGLDKNAIYLLVGLALTFVTLTIPIQFEGNQITIFWALEVVLLFWLSKKSKIDSFKIGAVIVQILTVISLFMDWWKYTYLEQDFTIILNPLFISGFITSISLFITYFLVKNENNIENKYIFLEMKFYSALLLVVGTVLSYLTGLLEINYQSYQTIQNYYSALAFPVTYHFTIIAILLFLAIKFKKEFIKGMLFFSAISIVFYVVYFYSLPKFEIIENFNLGTQSNYAYYFHYIILACLLYFGYQFVQNSSLGVIKNNKWLPWIFVFVIVYVFSNEVMIHGLVFSEATDTVALTKGFSGENGDYYAKYRFVTAQIKSVQSQIIKIGYPILWGLFSFIFLIVGIKKQWKTLRIIALSLLGITILKLFVYDIKNVSETGKIIAFILLGVLILIISFVYQKIRKLVVEEDSENKTDENI